MAHTSRGTFIVDRVHETNEAKRNSLSQQRLPSAAGAPKAGAGMAGTPNPPGALGWPKAGGVAGEPVPGAAPNPPKAGAGAATPKAPMGEAAGGVVGVALAAGVPVVVVGV